MTKWKKISEIQHIRAVYTRETLAATYEYKLPGQDQQRLKKAVNVNFVPFIRGVRGLHIFSRINGMQIWQ